uniref:Polymerase nucleotidyl transferase domain-containing protein n=1 Tax=Parascaris equorum TaxID=6256 RepID=A0A914R7R9_PAREQ
MDTHYFQHCYTFRLVVLVVYENANIVAVGSTVNGCGAYNSDMDLCLCLPDAVYGYDTDREFQVPILKLEMGNEYSELEIDINCNNVAGIYNSHLLHYYSRLIFSLCYAFKNCDL